MPKFKTVKELLSDPERWTKNWYAHDAQGGSINAQNREAACWCMLGAIIRVYGHGEMATTARHRLRDVIKKHYGEFDVARINDRESTTHADVMNILEMADI